MGDELTPGDIRARRFGLSRRGYDRSEVSHFLERVADRIEDLEAELAVIDERLDQFGIGDIPHFKNEIDELSVEIKAVLMAALTAAEGMRTRARTEADELLEDAEEASIAARGDAWESGSELLRQAQQTADELVDQARDDALFIRAEAEQDAKRLVTDARRQADDMVRSSREQRERIVVQAKVESEGILENARRSAEKAQERAKALEHRRSELLNELEEAESAIRDLETAKREGSSVGSGVTSNEGSNNWSDDDGTIRILPAARSSGTGEPPTVDADEMAAEVEELRQSVTLPQPTELEPGPEPEPELEPEPGPQLQPEPEREPQPEPEPQSEPEPEPASQPEIAEPETEEDIAPRVGPALEPERELPPVTVAEDRVTVVVDDPSISALFARLRRPAAEPQLEAVPEPDLEPEQEVEPPPLRAVPDLGVGEGFERRDRLLLPIENGALRGLKRRIVELQNRVLEELRTSGGDFRLGRELVVEFMGDEVDSLLTDGFRAGHLAAAESAGIAEPQLTGGPHRGAAESLATDLHGAVQAVLRRSDELGSRRLSSDVSRIFRSWRTDEAERSVRAAARRAFNDGLIAGYHQIGIRKVELVAPGRPCGRCAADTGVSWTPGDDLPDGVAVPPVGPGCSAMVVPMGSNGFDVEPRQ